MKILSTKGWSDYELLDSGDKKRLERFGKYILQRPDPQVMWKPILPSSDWQRADAEFVKDNKGKERWIIKTNVPKQWLLKWDNISFYAHLSPFKHTGVFPEQILQWSWMRERIMLEKRQLNILNLFAYTGIASLVAASAGAKITHVDASKPTTAWAKQNQAISKLSDKPIRWIIDDVIKFIEREIKRANRYDGIIMDPPVYGHGPNGERWDFNEFFPYLCQLCEKVLSKNPAFLLINAYAISASSIMLDNVLQDLTKNYKGAIEVGELALQESKSNRLLSTGIFGRWSSMP